MLFFTRSIVADGKKAAPRANLLFALRAEEPTRGGPGARRADQSGTPPPTGQGSGLSGPLPATHPGDVARIGDGGRGRRGAVEAAKRRSGRGEGVGDRTAARDGEAVRMEGTGARRG